MAILGVHNIACSFGERVLFEKSSFEIDAKDKVGLVGANGTGKTTLFKIILGEQSSSDGDIAIASGCKIGYLEQHAFSGNAGNLYNEVVSCFSHLADMEQEMNDITFQIDNGEGDTDKLVNRYDTLHHAYEAQGGLTYRARTRSMLLGLGFTEDDLLLPVSALSGGQRTRAMLARLLLSGSDLLLLDEPTNHLDIESTAFLEDYLSGYNGALVIISHDRYFLDKVTGKTLELEHCRFTMYNVPYSQYLVRKRENDEILKRHYDNQMREIKRIQGIVEQQRRWNRERNIKTAESKLKQIERLKKDLVKPEAELDKVHFTISSSHGSGNDVLFADDLSFAYGDTLIFRNLSMYLKKHDRAFLLGPNGCGKTTFFKILKGELTPKTGEVAFGSKISVGIYDQTQSDLNENNDSISEIRDMFPRMTDTEIRNALAAFLIRGDDVFKPISTLSGGERARVALLKIILSRPNLLLLDEPTNHLDIASKEALENALLTYDGTMLVISHDRYFINKLAEKIYYMEKDKTAEYDGNYDYFLQKRIVSKPAVQENIKKENDYKKQKEQQAAQRKLAGKIKRIEERIAQLEEEEAELNRLSAECSADYEKLMEITERLTAVQSVLNECYAEWESLMS